MPLRFEHETTDQSQTTNASRAINPLALFLVFQKGPLFI